MKTSTRYFIEKTIENKHLWMTIAFDLNRDIDKLLIWTTNPMRAMDFYLKSDAQFYIDNFKGETLKGSFVTEHEFVGDFPDKSSYNLAQILEDEKAINDAVKKIKRAALIELNNQEWDKILYNQGEFETSKQFNDWLKANYICPIKIVHAEAGKNVL